MTFRQEPDMHRTSLYSLFVIFASTFAIGGIGAQQPAQPAAQPPQGQPVVSVIAPPVPAAAATIDPEVPLVELAPLLQRVERASNKRFLVDRKLGARVFLGGVDADAIDYPVLLSILRANGLAAVEIEGRVNIVWDGDVRSLPAPIVQADDASIAADAWVTRVLATTNVGAAQLVPILRPLMPQAAHLAAHGDTNQLIVMDRYANVQRITAIVRSLDVPTRESPAR
jgi:general secretion pathway protein D